MRSDVHEFDFVQTSGDDRYYCTLHFDAGLIELDLDSRSLECEKVETSASIISQNFQSIWMECGILLRLVDVMNSIHILCHAFDIQGRKPCTCDFFFFN